MLKDAVGYAGGTQDGLDHGVSVLSCRTNRVVNGLILYYQTAVYMRRVSWLVTSGGHANLKQP